ncbi:2-hydroxychromene-2-carboxylate isomerase [Rhodovibrio salinarum]|uniref:2-hydroxychromene-2-carboxylate isomerase n=1 Tax=Rhodovibrio salinarum TaxID=1087 RepID=A0A934QK99_9PROT|nr:2-hydroxychromene-2-carboxylate isomerase [Rhodovibrio salinarum]MBK1698467.1 2-hydroxychromene-2-carboxylate isomerase [Rhodovibrio salinarum]
MPAPIEFYFDFSSPYGYLAAQEVEGVGRRQGREVVWKPFLLGAVFKTTGSAPLLDIPMKGDYAKRDMDRSARRIGVPFQLPTPFPFSAVAPARAFYWLADQNTMAAKDLAMALFHAAFGQGHDISAPDAVAKTAAMHGHDPAAVRAAHDDPAVKQRLKDEVQAAQDKGVFGSPFLLVDGEPFWGHDRLGDAEAWAKTGGW